MKPETQRTVAMLRRALESCSKRRVEMGQAAVALDKDLARALNELADLRDENAALRTENTALHVELRGLRQAAPQRGVWKVGGCDRNGEGRDGCGRPSCPKCYPAVAS